MAKFLSQHAKWIIAIFGLLVFAVSETDWLTDEPYWQKAEGALIDRRYELRGNRLADPDIKLIGLETSSLQLTQFSTNEIAASPTLQLMEQPWPWDRRIYAAVLDKLMNAGAKVVEFDFVFASVTEGDDEFARALQKYKDRVVIGELFAPEENANSADENAATVKLTAPNDSLLLPGVESTIGLVNQWTDADQSIRRVKYHTSLEEESLETSYYMDPNVAKVLRQLIASGNATELTNIAVLSVEKFNGHNNSPPDDNLHFVDFQGPEGTYQPLPIENMFVDELWKAPPFNGGETFSNKIVIVGPMAEILHDNHETAFGDMPGPELQAQVLSALLHRSWLDESPLVVGLVLTLLMLGIGLGICLRFKSAIVKPILLVATVFLFFVICQMAFNYDKLVLPMTQPLFCLVVPAAFGILFQFVLEQIERVRTRGVLERYVSKNVAKTIMDDNRSFLESLSGQKKSVTILFSDIRGFTSMTESSEAGKLVAQLNEYFLDMVDVVQEKNQGTLQKFIGDAIMAAWGDTHSEGLAEDARRAVSAALQMRPALVKLNEKWAAQPDRLKLKIGIGVNHGEVIVGNIGHPQRMEFTLLGDGVNLAARLESSTKQFHTDILIGEEAEKLSREFFVYRNVGAIAFKGKTKPIETFVLLSDRTQPAPAWLATYHEAIRLYRDRQFDVALARFQEVQQAIGGEDFLCGMYIEQCENLFHQGLKSGWDGSFALSEK